MSTRLIAVSGLGSKGPAAFLLETHARRILLDFGQGPDNEALPSFQEIGIIDALVLSHGHKDHIGAIGHIDRIGRPPVFATNQVLRQVSSDLDRRSLPARGRADILGLTVETGRDGHAPGGIWLRFDLGDGFLYTGDYSRESAVYPFDEPPTAASVLLDASYGTDDRPASFGQDELARMAAEGPMLLPAPADGRGPDMALFLHERGFNVALDDDTREAAQRLAAAPDDTRTDVGKRLAAMARTTRPLTTESRAHGVMIANNASGSSGIAASLIERWRPQPRPQIVFTGHLGKGSQNELLVSADRAKVMRWNVHPRLQDNLQLARSVGARTIIPAFLTFEDAQNLSRAFGEATVSSERVVLL